MKLLKKNIKFYTNQEMASILENESGKFTDSVKNFCTSKSQNEIRDFLKVKGLAEFEIIQLINLCPTQMIDLNLIIEEMEERFNENELNEILNLFI